MSDPTAQERARKRKQTNTVVYILGACLYVGLTWMLHTNILKENERDIIDEKTYFAKAEQTVTEFRPFLDDMKIDDTEADHILAVETAYEKESESDNLFRHLTRPDFTEVLREVNDLGRTPSSLERATYRAEYKEALDDYLDEMKPTTQPIDYTFSGKSMNKDSLMWLIGVGLIPILVTGGFIHIFRNPH